jgi:hypothetical protein
VPPLGTRTLPHHRFLLSCLPRLPNTNFLASRFSRFVATKTSSKATLSCAPSACYSHPTSYIYLLFYRLAPNFLIISTQPYSPLRLVTRPSLAHSISTLANLRKTSVLNLLLKIISIIKSTMTPNIYLMLQTLVTPTRWFAARPAAVRPVRKQEHWTSPIPGTYEHKPGRGWYLISLDEPEKHNIQLPQPVVYCKVTHEWILRTDFSARHRRELIKDSNGETREAGFFLLEDGITWVKAWDQHGKFKPPFERWCIDTKTKRMRLMVYGDDPEWVSLKSSRAASSRTLSPTTSAACTTCGSSRANSVFETKVHGVAGSSSGESQYTGSEFATPRSGALTGRGMDSKAIEQVSAIELRRRLTELEC